MIDWLRRDPRDVPSVTVGESVLPIVIRRHPTARRMIMRLSHDGREVRLTIPRWGRTDEAIRFARSRSDWLSEALADIPPAQDVLPGSSIAYRGRPLAIEHRDGAARKPEPHGDMLVVGGPAHMLAGRIRRWLEAEARLHLAADLSKYCGRVERDAPRLTLSNAQKRWGSCAHDGSIRVNWRLIMAPDFVRCSVVAHEVAHLLHFDHSPKFHALLANLFEGDIEEANLWLRRNGRSLYLPFG